MTNFGLPLKYEETEMDRIRRHILELLSDVTLEPRSRPGETQGIRATSSTMARRVSGRSCRIWTGSALPRRRRGCGVP